MKATNGVGAPIDFHEYQELPNGDRDVLVYRQRDHVDVSAFTGRAEDTDASVLDAEVQELAPDGSLIWRWNSGDAGHVDLAETGRWWNTIVPTTLPDGRNMYDQTHANAIQDDGDGIIVSMRHTDAVYRIRKSTGAIDWKLGGTPRIESLEIVGDEANAGQHLDGDTMSVCSMTAR